MEMESILCIISMPIILEGSPMSVMAHFWAICAFSSHMPTSVVENSSRSSTHTVMIWKSFPCCLMYMQGSDNRCVKAMDCNLRSN